MSWPAGDFEPGPRRLRAGLIGAGVLVALTAVAFVAVTRSTGPAAGSSSAAPAPLSSSSNSSTTNATGSASPDLSSTSASVTGASGSPVSSPSARVVASATATRGGSVAVVPADLDSPPRAQPVVSLSASPEESGLVDVDSTLEAQGEVAEGTGMILNTDGDVLTNNHVVDGATSISVTVISTNQTYPAIVVGTDATADVAVLQIWTSTDAASFGDSATVKLGDTVTAVGNAGGVGGMPTAAPGTILALDQSITATSEDGTDTEHLTDMIASNAQIQPGDSGGPLYDAAGQIIGMDTAGGTTGSGEIVAYSIPIDQALAVATEIEDGSSSSAIQLGTPAFLGVVVTDAPGGAGADVQQVQNLSPAASAGIEPADVITALGGVPITSAASLGAALATHRGGDQVSIAWTRTPAAGPEPFTETVTLGAAPAT